MINRLFIVSAFIDYFPDGQTECTNVLKNNSRQILLTGSYYVFDCVFNTIGVSGSAQTSSGRGGTIYMSSSSDLILLIECCSFSHCFSSNYGGAIFVNNTANEKFLIVKSIAFSCYTSIGEWPGGQFYYASVNNTLVCCLTSIAQCSPENL